MTLLALLSDIVLVVGLSALACVIAGIVIALLYFIAWPIRYAMSKMPERVQDRIRGIAEVVSFLVFSVGVVIATFAF